MSFSEKDKDDYYVPGSIGNGDITEAIAIRELKKISTPDNDISLMGFWFPREAGKYSSRVYLDKLDSFEKIENPVLVCVYTENKSITQLTWSKIVPVNIK